MWDDYLKSVQDAIQHQHGCASRYLYSTRVKEEINGKTVWEGSVEVFALVGHSQAKVCFAWGFQEEGIWRYVTVTSPPIKSPLYAVRAFLIQEAKKKPI
jgi:hypothetical protein